MNILEVCFNVGYVKIYIIYFIDISQMDYQSM